MRSFWVSCGPAQSIRPSPNQHGLTTGANANQPKPQPCSRGAGGGPAGGGQERGEQTEALLILGVVPHKSETHWEVHRGQTPTSDGDEKAARWACQQNSDASVPRGGGRNPEATRRGGPTSGMQNEATRQTPGKRPVLKRKGSDGDSPDGPAPPAASVTVPCAVTHVRTRARTHAHSQ